MSDMHPHWRATYEEDSESPRSAMPAGVRVPVAAASRMPAAIVGILVFTAIGVTAMGGWQALTAQVGGGSASTSAAGSSAPLVALEIRITGTGFTPASATVRPGQKIIWINEQAIPHILTSQTLRDGSGSYLNTAAIFPGSKESFTVGKRENDRTHTYVSTTDTSLSGKIVVSKSGQAPSSRSSTSSSAGALGPLGDVPLISGQGSRSSVPRSSSSSSRTSTVALGASSSSLSSLRSSISSISSSSLTSSSATSVTSAPSAPSQYPAAPGGTTLDQYGFPQPDVVAEDPVIIAQDTLPPPNPHPATQPDTGPGIWAAILLSILAFVWFMRNYFVRITATR